MRTGMGAAHASHEQRALLVSKRKPCTRGLQVLLACTNEPHLDGQQAARQRGPWWLPRRQAHRPALQRVGGRAVTAVPVVGNSGAKCSVERHRPRVCTGGPLWPSATVAVGPVVGGLHQLAAAGGGQACRAGGWGQHSQFEGEPRS